jgi:hypothetical protein
MTQAIRPRLEDPSETTFGGLQKIARSFLAPLGASYDLLFFCWMILSSSRKLKYFF